MQNRYGRGMPFAFAVIFISSGACLDSVHAATWTNISAGLPAAPVHASRLVISPGQSTILYARAYGADGIGRAFKSLDGAASWAPITNVVGVYSLVADPRDPSTIYVLTSRGILKSSDGGGSWKSQGAGQLPGFVSFLAIDPVNPSKLYAVTQSGIYKSLDGATSWNALDTGFPNSYISDLAIDPVNPSRIYAIGSFHSPGDNSPPKATFLSSVDEGATWNLMDTGLPSSSSIGAFAISSSAPSVLYAAATTAGSSGPSSEALIKSADGGITWTTLDTGLPSGADIASINIAPQDSSSVYLAVNFFFADAGGIVESTDGGASWKTIKTDLPADTPMDVLAIDPATPSTMYTIGEGVVFKSLNGGLAWQRSTTGLSSISVGSLNADPTDANTVYAGAGNVLFKSVDGGGTWGKLFAFQLFASGVASPFGSFFPDGSPTYPRSMVIDPTNANVLYVSTARGNGCDFSDKLLFKSTDGGTSWTDSVSPNDSGCVLDGSLGPSAGLKAMDPSDPNTLYVSESDDGDEGWDLLRTRDGGATWTSFGDFPNRLNAGVWTVAIDPNTPATIYAGLDDAPTYSDSDNGSTPGLGGVYKSTDGGGTWTAAGLSGAAVNRLVIDHTQPNVIYAATEGNYGAPAGFRGLFKSVDGGATWSAISNGLVSLVDAEATVTGMAIDPADSKTLYIGASIGGVFTSMDGGSTWLPLNDGLTNLDVGVLAVAPGTGHVVYAGTSGGVFKIHAGADVQGPSQLLTRRMR